jgi:hypothetical protein
LALAALLMLAAGQARASVTLRFSDYSSDSTPISAIPAEVTFTVSGSQLLIDINNLSSYGIRSLYFNTDTSLTGLSFSGSVDPNWGISGTGTTQAIGADGMGRYNWEIEFGPPASSFLPAGGTTLLTLNMTGTTTEATIGSKLSTNPPGSVEALAVLKFQTGPNNDDSTFGGSVTRDPDDPPPVNEVPAPATLIFAFLGLGMGGLAYARRKTTR